VDVTESVPDWEPYTQPIAPEGTPSVLYIVLDDVGVSAMEPFGGFIETPNINRIAERGLTFHTTALCSPTRSCLMTGRNHTTNGIGTITEAASGFPSSNGHVPHECGTIAEVLGERGWNTYMTGKWHLTPEDEMNLALKSSITKLGNSVSELSSSALTAATAIPGEVSAVKTAVENLIDATRSKCK
jgi:arylsulfatase